MEIMQISLDADEDAGEPPEGVTQENAKQILQEASGKAFDKIKENYLKDLITKDPMIIPPLV